MPVDTSRLRQVIFEDDPHPIAFICLYGGTRRAAVEPPQIQSPPWNDSLLHRLRDQMEYFHAIIDGEREIADVKRSGGHWH